MVAQSEGGRDNPNPRIRVEFIPGRKTFVVKTETNAHILPGTETSRLLSLTGGYL
jgi:hypothetical protein